MFIFSNIITRISQESYEEQGCKKSHTFFDVLVGTSCMVKELLGLAMLEPLGPSYSAAVMKSLTKAA